jgi:hypothetical protein
MATLPLLAMAGADAADAMSAYRWSKRPLIVFAGHAGDLTLVEQRRVVETSRAGFAERDMVVVYVVGDKVSADPKPGPGIGAAALRAHFGVQEGTFRAVLVGKDGGAKLSSGQPLSAATLFRTIDAMPMRRDEVRGR